MKSHIPRALPLQAQLAEGAKLDGFADAAISDLAEALTRQVTEPGFHTGHKDNGNMRRRVDLGMVNDDYSNL